jgi:hypothetical protein
MRLMAGFEYGILARACVAQPAPTRRPLRRLFSITTV